jgi:hypothetical protein
MVSTVYIYTHLISWLPSATTNITSDNTLETKHAGSR